MFEELASEFSEEAKVLLEQLEGDLLALEAESAAELRAESTARIRRVLHTLKGNAGMLGAPSLQAALHRMEDTVASLSADPSLVSWLLSATDAVREEVEAIGAGRAVELAADAILRLASGEQPDEMDASADAGFLSGSEVRVPRERLDQLLAATGELVVTNTQLQKLLASGGLNPKQSVHWMDRLDRTVRLIHELVVKARTLPVRTLLSRFARLVHDDARAHGREAKLELRGEHVQVDRVVLEALGAPLMHLVRNAVIHGLEPADQRHAAGKPRFGTVSLEASAAGGRVHFLISDDGRGLDAEKILARAREMGAPPELQPQQLIFFPGFSTATTVTEGAGRGVGLDVVARAIGELGGTIEVRSEPGRGTTFHLSVPASLALQRAVLCGIGDEVFAVPATSIVEALRCSDGQVRWLGRGRALDHGGTLVPLVDVARTLGTTPHRADYVLVLQGGGTVALPVDALLGQQDFVFQPLDPSVSGRGPANGTALLGDGRVVLRLDPERLRRAPLEASP